MNEERTIDLGEILRHILLKWRSIIVCMIVFAILADGFSAVKSYRYVSQVKQEEEVQDFSQYEDALSEREIQEVKNAAENYAIYEESYIDYKEYNTNSIKMQLDANAVPTQKLIYRITGNRNDIENISDTYVELIPNDEICQNVLEKTGWDVDASYIKELISVTNTHMDALTVGGLTVSGVLDSSEEGNKSVLITITIMADTEKNCKTIGSVVEQSLGVVTTELQKQFGEYTINLISSHIDTETNKELLSEQQTRINEMNNSSNSMQNLENALSDDQKDYFDALVSDEIKQMEEKEQITVEEVQEEKPEVQYINIKYVIAGAFLGAVLYCIYAICRFLLDKRLISKTYIVDDLRCSLLGMFSKQNGKEKGVIDRWINKIFGYDTVSYEKENCLNLLCAEIKIIMQKKNIGSIYITGSAESEETKDFLNILRKSLEKENVLFSVGKSIVYDVNSLETFSESEAVIFLEQINCSLIKDIRKETAECTRYGINNLGFILID